MDWVLKIETLELSSFFLSMLIMARLLALTEQEIKATKHKGVEVH